MTKNELKRRYQPINISMRSNSMKREQSAKIEAQTAEFLASGGKIKCSEVGRSRAVDLTFRHYALSGLDEVEGVE
jgi:hypothetical protein